MKKIGMESQVGFRWDRGTIDRGTFLLTSIFRRNLRVKYTRLLSCLLYFTIAKLGPCVKIYLSAFEVSITGVLVACAV